MHQEKYTLNWHTYSDHLRSMMKELMTNDNFADVTLVTDDKKHIKGHKNILSACSPVFREMLQREKGLNPIIFLRGINFSEIESIMQFIHLGEATFYEENTDEFLAVAKSLEIKELCNAGEVINEPGDEPLPNNPVTSPDQLKEPHDISVQSQQNKGDVVSENRKYECEQCNKTFSRRGLDYHIQSFHQGVRYACDQCDYQATLQSSLTKHIQSKHEGIKYTCDQCDYQATRQDHLAVHIKTKHEGVNYTCNLCDYSASWPQNLTRHKRRSH